MPSLIVSSAESDLRLDVFLAAKTGKSRSFIQEQLKAGRIQINSQKGTKASTRLNEGDHILFELEDSATSTLTPIPGPIEILFEDDHLLVINKSQGVVIHPAPGHSTDTLVHHLLHYLSHESLFKSPPDLRPGIVHRLDKGTSGVLLIAKNREVQEALSQQFKERQVTKVYECFVWGQLIRSGTLTTSIGRDRVHRKKMSSKTQKARSAETRFSPQKTFRHVTHLEVYPLTGRTHQIRVHLSEFGHSILGDSLYGKGATAKRVSNMDPELTAFIKSANHTFLHARSLTFSHPITSKEQHIEAPRPETFNQLLDLLNKKDCL